MESDEDNFLAEAKRLSELTVTPDDPDYFVVEAHAEVLEALRNDPNADPEDVALETVSAMCTLLRVEARRARQSEEASEQDTEGPEET
jgi:hypothetical protein